MGSLSNPGGVNNWAVRLVSLQENLQPTDNSLTLAQAHGPGPRDILAHLLALAGII